MNEVRTSEEKIKIAAKQIFLKKGFARCTTREIASESGVNLALVNYYFKSKELLFQIVFQSMMEEFMNGMIEVFGTTISLKEKLKILIEREFEFYSTNPDLPGFILNEIGKNSVLADQNKQAFISIQNSGIFEEALREQAKGKMRKLDMFELTLLIMSNCQFPFVSRPLMSTLMDLDELTLKNKLMEYRNVVSEMLMNYIFLHEK